jgi:hypothetical protein
MVLERQEEATRAVEKASVLYDTLAERRRRAVAIRRLPGGYHIRSTMVKRSFYFVWSSFVFKNVKSNVSVPSSISFSLYELVETPFGFLIPYSSSSFEHRSSDKP